MCSSGRLASLKSMHLWLKSRMLVIGLTSWAPSEGGRSHGNRPHDLRCQLHIEADVNYYFMVQAGTSLLQAWSKFVPSLGQVWTKLGPSVIQAWTTLGPSLVQVCTKLGPSLDQAWTKLGPSLDQSWIKFGLSLIQA